MKVLTLVGISLLAAILLACGSSNSMSSGGSGSGSGSGGSGTGNDVGFSLVDNWQITLNSSVNSGTTGSAGGSLQNNGLTNAVTGLMGNIQPPCAKTANVSGSLNGKTITFALSENGQSINFNGTINDNINAMTGTYNAQAGGCTNGDSGTWTATRIPAITGNWSGTLNPSSPVGAGFQVSVPLTQNIDTGMVTGTASISGSPCFTSIALATPNFIAGQQLVLAGQSSGTLQLNGTLNLSGTSMNVTYTISGGSCDGQSGSGTLLKQ